MNFLSGPARKKNVCVYYDLPSHRKCLKNFHRTPFCSAPVKNLGLTLLIISYFPPNTLQPAPLKNVHTQKFYLAGVHKEGDCPKNLCNIDVRKLKKISFCSIWFERMQAQKPEKNIQKRITLKRIPRENIVAYWFLGEPAMCVSLKHFPQKHSLEHLFITHTKLLHLNYFSFRKPQCWPSKTTTLQKEKLFTNHSIIYYIKMHRSGSIG